jgi:hypothetical protein
VQIPEEEIRDLIKLLTAKLKSASADDESKAPLHFTDALGRKFSFPWKLCNTWQVCSIPYIPASIRRHSQANATAHDWLHVLTTTCQGMEELIVQAFLHVEIIGTSVREGHYDLIGPNGEIVLPSVWAKVVQPGWSMTMHMWPLERSEPRVARPDAGLVLPGGPAAKGSDLEPFEVQRILDRTKRVVHGQMRRGLPVADRIHDQDGPGAIGEPGSSQDGMIKSGENPDPNTTDTSTPLRHRAAIQKTRLAIPQSSRRQSI